MSMITQSIEEYASAILAILAKEVADIDADVQRNRRIQDDQIQNVLAGRNYSYVRIKDAVFRLNEQLGITVE